MLPKNNSEIDFSSLDWHPLCLSCAYAAKINAGCAIHEQDMSVRCLFLIIEISNMICWDCVSCLELKTVKFLNKCIVLLTSSTQKWTTTISAKTPCAIWFWSYRNTTRARCTIFLHICVTSVPRRRFGTLRQRSRSSSATSLFGLPGRASCKSY